MRRAKGSGSIRQRGKDNWQIRYDGPPDENGSVSKISETVRGSRRDAERRLRERLGSIDSGEYVVKSKATLGEFINRWFESYVVTNTTLRTQQDYRYFLRRHIIPNLGAIPIQNLKPIHIQRLYAYMLESGLNSRTVLHCHRILRQALSHAVRWGELVRNPADAVTPPRPEKTELKTWDEKTFAEFLEVAKESPFVELYSLAAFTGMRRSEMCGLKWADVDLDRAELHVVRTLQRIDGVGLHEGQPKTAKSRRTIALSRGAIDVLRRVKVNQLEDQLALGELWQGKGYVFANEDGTPISGERVSKDFARIVKQANLPPLTLHGLRHTAASLMIAGGVHARTIADILGHSTISTTMDVYGHLISGVQEDAVKILDERLANGK